MELDIFKINSRLVCSESVAETRFNGTSSMFFLFSEKIILVENCSSSCVGGIN